MEEIQKHIINHGEEQSKIYSQAQDSMKECFKDHENLIKDISQNIKYVNEYEKEVAITYEGMTNTADSIQEKYTKVVEELNGVTTMLFQVTGSLNNLKDLSTTNKEFNHNLIQLTSSVNQQNDLISYLTATITDLTHSLGENKENKESNEQNTQETLPEH